MPFAACLEELLLPYALGLSETERAGLQIWHEGTGMLAELPTKSTMGGGLRAGELVSGASSEVCEAPGAGDTELCLQLAVFDARGRLEGALGTLVRLREAGPGYAPLLGQVGVARREQQLKERAAS